MVIVQKEWYNIDQCNRNPQNLYIFGDNSKRFGNAGQAQIRCCKNSFGIATKTSPSNSMNSFFTDSIEDLEIIEEDIKRLISIKDDYENIIFPYDGLGTGLSDMPNKCPLLYKRLNSIIFRKFKVRY